MIESAKKETESPEIVEIPMRGGFGDGQKARINRTESAAWYARFPSGQGQHKDGIPLSQLVARKGVIHFYSLFESAGGEGLKAYVFLGVHPASEQT